MRTPCRTGKVLASAFCLSLAVAAARGAQDAPTAPAAAQPAEAKQAAANLSDSYAQIRAEYDKAQQAFSEAYRAAKTDDERSKIVESKYPKPEKYTPRFLAYAEKNPDDPQAIDALLFVVGMSRGGDDFKRALDQISTRHAASERVAPIVERLGFNGDPAAEAVLLTILEKNPSRQVKGQTCYALGQHYLYAGKPADAEKRFEEVAADYADVPGGYRGTLGEAAKAQLHEARNLVVGKVAPEIEGEDVGGKKFKLTEYRGKVVVLDFWGDW
jgi:hypothetical protein